ncbi:MAG: hypothetical protein M1834_001787 [Cirrosporium novae-zelandiae]|nr:MAG: hypothetical protein M1834_001787 [Cirrosporium novae-zelandiae]
MASQLQLPLPFSDIPREKLLYGFSPIEKLSRMSKALGDKVTVWAKREDSNSGIAFGGNKVRKLEYLLADALGQGCDTLISIGGVQSNHTRQVAGVAAKYGMKAKLVQEHWVDWDDPLYETVGNLQISRLTGADVHMEPKTTFGIQHKPTLQRLQEEAKEQGLKPYYIPAGASDHPFGGLGFARWAFEVEEQEKALSVFFNTVVVCAVTGSTFAGMIAGFKLAQKNGSKPRKVIGIDASAKVKETFDQVLRIARFTGVKIGLRKEDIKEDDVILIDRYHGPAYGVPDQPTIDAIKFGASTEAFITDPVYEGKSLAGMIDMIKKGEIAAGSNVLYAHLGGQLALSRALYRRLLSQCVDIPMPEAQKTALRTLIQYKFRENRHVTSLRLLHLAFQASYDAAALLRKASEGDNSSLSRIKKLLQQLPHAHPLLYPTSPKLPPPLTTRDLEKSRKRIRWRNNGPPPYIKFTTPHTSLIFSRPREHIAGRRRIPVLTVASQLPYLRTTKPQPVYVSRVISQLQTRRHKKFQEKERLEDKMYMANLENQWDSLLETNCKISIDQETSESNWHTEVQHAYEGTLSWIEQFGLKNAERSKKYWEIIKREKELAAKEKMEKSRERSRDQKEEERK